MYQILTFFAFASRYVPISPNIILGVFCLFLGQGPLLDADKVEGMAQCTFYLPFTGEDDIQVVHPGRAPTNEQRPQLVPSKLGTRQMSAKCVMHVGHESLGVMQDAMQWCDCWKFRQYFPGGSRSDPVRQPSLTDRQTYTHEVID